MLTEQQNLHFKTFGFVVLRQVFTPDEMNIINREFDHGLEAAYRHLPFDGTVRHWVTMMGRSTPFFGGLLEDPRLCGVAEQLYGEDALGIATDANRYVGNTGWHPDTHSIHQYGIKFAFYLQPVGPETGALRVIPGSHRNPFHSELRRFMSEFDCHKKVPCYVCDSEPGDVVGFDLRLWHASYGGSSDRRMCTCVYYNNPRTPEEIETTRDQGANNGKATAKYNRPNDPPVDPFWLTDPDLSPKRRRWLDRLLELGYYQDMVNGDS